MTIFLPFLQHPQLSL